MQREPVDSEAIRSIGYDIDRRVLEVEFHGGAVYRYFDVPDEVYVELMQAASLGEAFAHRVRNAGFDYLQVRSPRS